MKPPHKVTCPAGGNPSGCGHTFQATLDFENLADCPECGLFFNPDHPANIVLPALSFTIWTLNHAWENRVAGPYPDLYYAFRVFDGHMFTESYDSYWQTEPIFNP